MIKLWKWLYKLSKRKVREGHLSKYHADIKCPNCKEWFSITGIDHEHKVDLKEFGSACTCGNCGHLSYWNQVAFPFPALCDKDGNILKDEL